MPDEKRDERDALWRLVDGKCTQLKDAVWGARIPFLVGLLWTFLWILTIYNHDYGYTNELIARFEKVGQEAARVGMDSAMAGSSLRRYHSGLYGKDGRRNPAVQVMPPSKALADSDARVGSGVADSVVFSREALARRAWETQYALLLKQQVDYWGTSVPGITGRVTAFDWGIVGQLGLLFVMIWFFYATRRENHVVRSFIDFQDEAPKDRWYPRRFVLAPQQDALDPVHYSVAYHSVAHRFLFIFSRRSEPLLMTTVILMALPIIVATWNLYTDVRDLRSFQDIGVQGVVRTVVEALVWIPLVFFTLWGIRYTVQTSVVLNAWYLACRDCWERALEGRDRMVGRVVLVDREQQRAWPFDNARGVVEHSHMGENR